MTQKIENKTLPKTKRNNTLDIKQSKLYIFVGFHPKTSAQSIETLVFSENFVKKNLQKQVKGVQKGDNLVAKKAIRTNAFRAETAVISSSY